VERVFRDLKHTVDIRPVYHRLADRIRAHVLLCWLALLLIRVAENETGQTWRRLTQAFGSLQVGIHATPAGEVWQTNPVTAEAKRVFDTLGVKPPPRYYALPTPRPVPFERFHHKASDRLIVTTHCSGPAGAGHHPAFGTRRHSLSGP